ncbi:MAG: beta-phosphoglucomutase [Tissierellia bacterium]|jgi:alpha,alpha-trehalose phosphorylase|nr:beta-phosphoglucomutase [Tissierellia bacterium]MDD3226564.1 beta-phosphoglucomutase [Tissierellia bacterium]MDD3750703.1 beta-phosphoglucomutase [Tissierellia bacterium]MDD4045533.1 beta-phosphoglucomutase [Tissierellia bacterium]MDD4678227.1 beta-phosphoglucomutase [Tissierellia bacterium]
MKKFREEGLNIEKLPLLETLMSLGNGYIGVRGYLEEFDYPGSVRGSYINGIYEQVPMVHAEWAWGFPLQSDRMPNLVDLTKILIILDGEEVDIEGKIEEFKRELDFENGLSLRSYKYITKSGKEAKIYFEQLISFTHKELRSWTLNIEYNGEIEVKNNIHYNILNFSSKDDPRVASTQIPLVKVERANYQDSEGELLLKTIRSGLQVKIELQDSGEFKSTSTANDDGLNISFIFEGQLRIDRMIKYEDSLRKVKSEYISKGKLYKAQSEYLENYNKNCSIDFLDNKELDNAMDFMKFHMLQSTTQDIFGNIAAKGLSGEGYEGHYFWDTEIFLFPVWLLWDEERAKNLLLYRYNQLNAARRRALEMGHGKGACFPWRTISGIESSGYFPAGSAQYHINFDIAYTFIQWWLTNKDIDFLAEYSMELLLETARTALEIGSFQSDGFHIHCVTGPDEYTAMVSDNYYTNKMAQYNLRWAINLWNILKAERPDSWAKLKKALNITDNEINNMERAANEMFFIYDEVKGIIAQDSTFLTKEAWPEENNLRPLLLHYHPLTIYRYQILKQADTALALHLLSDEDEELMKRTFYYYENINSHDSSLSPSISVLMACRFKDGEMAYKYFMDSVYMDLKDLNHNTSDGLHMANIGGTLISVLSGFGGVRIKEDGLHIDPYVPKQLGRIRFKLTWRKTVLEIFISEEEVDIKKVWGPATEVILQGKRVTVGQKAVLFDLDGVLTGTSDNHFYGWKRMCADIGLNLPEEFRDRVRGISRKDALDMILIHFDLKYSNEEKLQLMDKKNNYYKESIASFSRDNLYPGVIELLEGIRKAGGKIGLVSVSRNAAQLLRSMDIEKYFDAIVDPSMLSRGKPYPDPFLAAAEMLSVEPGECLGIEDAKAGIESIKSAGMKSVGIGNDDLREADSVFQTIQDASEYILKWLEGPKWQE